MVDHSLPLKTAWHPSQGLPFQPGPLEVTLNYLSHSFSIFSPRAQEGVTNYKYQAKPCGFLSTETNCSISPHLRHSSRVRWCLLFYWFFSPLTNNPLEFSFTQLPHMLTSPLAPSVELSFHFQYMFFFGKNFLDFNWRISTLQYCDNYFTICQHESATGIHMSPHPEPPSHLPPHPSALSQSTSFECLASCIELGLVIYFTYHNIHVSMLFSQITSHWVQKSVLYILRTRLFPHLT